ncbi:MAG: AGE family epimerase/isomerase [Gemmatimonadota bacterium]|nr:AGE family epimerase/isomerase [Gemmatimonadota bacterium]
MAFATEKYLEKFRAELYQNVLPFWLEHSLDTEYGGYFNCLARDGMVYDTTKHMWLQCRQVWMLSKLYNTVEKRPEWLEAARLGYDFIAAHGRGPAGRVYFSLDRRGRPLFIQRKIFAECFYIIALAEYSRAVGEPAIREEALRMFGRVLEWVQDPAPLGKPRLEGAPAVSELAVPMIILSLVDEVAEDSELPAYDPLVKKCLAEIGLHLRPELKLVLENVSPAGELLEGSLGRLVNPGHAIETGWFVLEQAIKRNDPAARQAALRMIDWSFEHGWDSEYGGFYYFLDSGGFPPVQLEWPMKLWWPHCEAAYAMLLAYKVTGEEKYAGRFEQVADYAFEHFSDPGHGEWFGYLDRQGRPTHSLKGGPYKGCFHVPRFLWLAIRLLEQTWGAEAGAED